MKKTIKLLDLDCAVCASKIEEAVKKLDGVSDVSVSFIAQKLSFEANDTDMEKIIEQITKTVKRVEPDCALVL